MARALARNEVARRRPLRDRAPKSPKQVDIYVGLRIRDRRKELGFSQTALGDEVGVAFQQIQKYENGRNRVGASRLAAIAKALEVPVDYFFPDADKEALDPEDIAAQIDNLSKRIRFLTKERDRLRQLL
jgi:transcriptional regulator with XRE-family HTH domain